MARCLSACSSRAQRLADLTHQGGVGRRARILRPNSSAANSATESRTAQLRFAGQEWVIACSRAQQNNNNNDPCEQASVGGKTSVRLTRRAAFTNAR